MPERRRWSEFPKRMKHEINGTSGITGFAGISLGVASLAFLGTATVYFFASLSLIIILPTIFFVVKKSIPPALADARDFIGKEVPIGKLHDFLTPPRKVAFIGPAGAGKTTLKDRLLFGTKDSVKTQKMSAHLIALGPRAEECIILLDGGGDIYSQQFRLLELADIVCIILDHHARNDIIHIDESRINKNVDFVDQACLHLREIESTKKIFYIALNKRDLWQQETSARREWLWQTFPYHAGTRWRIDQIARDQICYAAHSNKYPEDIAALVEFLRNAK